MNSIGETLRRERLRLGLDLDQVAERTKIGTRLLQAMEAGEFEKLPGGVFTRSFIKQYARVLGLDEEAIGAEFKSMQQKQEESPPPSQGFRSQTDIPSSPVFETGGSRMANLSRKSISTLVSAGWVAAAISVCALSYFLLSQHTAPSATESARVTPPETATPAAAPDERAHAAAATSVPAESASANPAGPVQVLLKASEDSWISVTADGKSKFSGVLQANDSKQIDANEKVKVIAGNSGGLDISLNGKSIGPIGKTGQRRVVELTPEGAHVVPRTPPPTRDPVL